MDQFKTIHDYDRSDLFFKDPPFLATARESVGEGVDFVGKIISGDELKGGGQVTFKKGKVFQCYYSPYYEEKNKEEDEEAILFKRGSQWHYPKNISERFDFEIGDKFVLRGGKESDSAIEIVKIPKPADGEIGNSREGDILIWETWERGGVCGYTQYLSDHVYLQNTQEHREFALKYNLIEQKADGSRRYKMNGGWVFIKNGKEKEGDVSEYIPSFEYVLEPDEDRYFYIQLDAKITKGKTQDWHDADRPFIEATTILDAKEQEDEPEGHEVKYQGKKIKLICSETPITQAEIVLNRPYIGKDCAKSKREKRKQITEDYLGRQYDFNGKEFERVYGEKKESGRMWYNVGRGGNLELILAKKDTGASFNTPSAYEDGFKPTEDIESNADITHLCITASDVPKDRCPPPQKIKAFMRFVAAVTDQEEEEYGEDDIIRDLVLINGPSSISYKGNGSYASKCVKIPKNRTVLLDENNTPLAVEGTECDYQAAGLGKYFKHEITTLIKSRTSELVFESYAS